MALEGNIVLSLNFFEQSENNTLTNEQFSILEKVHERKLEMCDEVFVIDVNDYIGESTQKEILFAIKKINLFVIILKKNNFSLYKEQ